MKTSSWLLGALVPLLLASPAASGELLRSSFDDETAVLSPAIGTGVGASISSSPTNDFVTGASGMGLFFDAVTERVSYAQTDGSVDNVDLHVGTMTMWYRPAYDSSDPTKTTIFGTGQWQSPGSLHIGKHNPSNDNDIFVIHFDDSGTLHQSPISHADFSWTADAWIFLRLTWDFTVPAGEQNYHFYIDEVEIPFSTTANGPPTTGPFNMGTESPTNYIYVGARDDTGQIIPWGVHDDLTIHDEVVPPSNGSGGAGGSAGQGGAGASSSSGAGAGNAGGNDAGGSAASGGSDGQGANDADDGGLDTSADGGCTFGVGTDDSTPWGWIAIGLALLRRRRD